MIYVTIIIIAIIIAIVILGCFHAKTINACMLDNIYQEYKHAKYDLQLIKERLEPIKNKIKDYDKADNDNQYNYYIDMNETKAYIKDIDTILSKHDINN